ncbi:restriction endonuclease [Neobacillus sp. OS1-2]|uniref:restriction endonuclease n=1 Tax=Neobacillus sp. OS1-2 TaxID=3070680 RepID=UPI0027DF0FC6|nr:restriction endonuclease [Neobacillus sp. OS1-2]WML38139.1 restriction endonuclease [Neobacillus sp. OS1-2]
MYEIEVSHKGLNKYRVIRGNNKYVVQQKAEMQIKTWEEMWEKKQRQVKQKNDREHAAKEKQEKKELADRLTNEAVELLDTIQNTLIYTLDIDDKVNWDDLKDHSKFTIPTPKMTKELRVSKEPLQTDALYQPKLRILDKLLTNKKQKKIDELSQLFNRHHEQWEKEKEEILKTNKESQEKFEKALNTWNEEKARFLANQLENNKAVDDLKESYLKGRPSAIQEYCDVVLSNSKYPDCFPQEFDLDFNDVNNTMIVEYLLPNPNQLPTLKEVKYVQTKDELREIHLSVSALNKIYDALLYQIALRTIHELFEADTINKINSIVFNGWVKSIDKATGKEVKACILSVQTLKQEFEEIQLALVDPKLCFKNLKGIGSSKLYSLTPIAPIIQINRQDSRFVSSYNVADSLDESDNLAAMDWEDFEHLIRELFEKEFNQNGGEVKITRASRDGGVDAVAFDPDPIRGGKIVIQAKRYTNVVGVSAVRDLYGTVLNEGATKGILVSTADYGPDAYNFAKDKPLTLLNGNNLLHLLQKHGYHATIDIKQAKEILAGKK